MMVRRTLSLQPGTIVGTIVVSDDPPAGTDREDDRSGVGARGQRSIDGFVLSEFRDSWDVDGSDHEPARHRFGRWPRGSVDSGHADFGVPLPRGV